MAPPAWRAMLFTVVRTGGETGPVGVNGSDGGRDDCGGEQSESGAQGSMAGSRSR